MSTIKAVWLIPAEDMSMTFRTAYNNRLRSLLEPGEKVPYSIHLKCTEFACCELRAMIMDVIGEARPVEPAE